MNIKFLSLGRGFKTVLRSIDEKNNTVKPRNSKRQNSGKPRNSGPILAPNPLFSKKPSK